MYIFNREIEILKKEEMIEGTIEGMIEETIGEMMIDAITQSDMIEIETVITVIVVIKIIKAMVHQALIHVHRNPEIQLLLTRLVILIQVMLKY